MDENPYQSPPAALERVSALPISPSLQQRKRNCLLLWLALLSPIGALQGAFADSELGGVATILGYIVSAASMARWTYLDAEERQFRLWRYFVPLLVICPGPLIVMPVYFFQTRGFRGGVWACLLGFGFLFAAACLQVAGQIIAVLLLRGDILLNEQLFARFGVCTVPLTTL